MPKSSCCNGDVCFYPPKVLLRRMTAMQFFFASQTLTSTPYPSSAAGGPLAVSMDCSQWILSVERCQPKHRVVIGLATRASSNRRPLRGEMANSQLSILNSQRYFLTKTMITSAMTPPPSIQTQFQVLRSAEVWPSMPGATGLVSWVNWSDSPAPQSAK